MLERWHKIPTVLAATISSQLEKVAATAVPGFGP